ncbi:hypothetical protein PanWU01x14_043950 [Parasponia andersonii]|uniref:Uncharacterized protein n=1 Tax=Parasponia andersonii TaxID=3476 RepID=A0A2P5DP25_PARAD|nr:hypothetical protein PanWU01x14_043950 [Parasponia andersonii]
MGTRRSDSVSESPRSGDVQLQNASKCSVDGNTISLVEGR